MKLRGWLWTNRWDQSTTRHFSFQQHSDACIPNNFIIPSPAWKCTFLQIAASKVDGGCKWKPNSKCKSSSSSVSLSNKIVCLRYCTGEWATKEWKQTNNKNEKKKKIEMQRREPGILVGSCVRSAAAAIFAFFSFARTTATKTSILFLCIILSPFSLFFILWMTE